MANNLNSFLGTGWDFPPCWDKDEQSVSMISNEEDIRSSLLVLLSTDLGERVMRSDYGTNLRELVFAPIDEGFKTYIRKQIEDAIYLHEPRIRPDDIVLELFPEEGKVIITVEYIIPATNSRGNVVYPFYLIEGTNIA